MSESKYLADRLREVILTGKWIANTNFKDQLTDLEWDLAIKQKNSQNSIASLAQHIHYYISGIHHGLIEGKLNIHDKYSFDFPLIKSQSEWHHFKQKFWSDTENLCCIVEGLTAEDLQNDFIDKKYGSLKRNIEGMIEHAYYHLGQIVLLKKQINFTKT